MEGEETLPAFSEEVARTEAKAPGGQDPATHEGTNGTAPPEKKKRGRPKDLNAPKRPQTAKARVTMPARERLAAEKPDLKKDLKGMFDALNAVWEEVPQEEKDRLQKEYEEEMEIWKPKWEAYKKTDSYREFCLAKQEYKDKKEKKKFLKAESKKAPKKPRPGYGIFSDEIRLRVKEEVMGAAEYQEMAQQQKEEFMVKFAEYKKTQDWKDFQLKKAKMDGRHALNALTRDTYKDAPGKPPNAFQFFKAKNLKQVMEEKKGASAGELSKILGQMWKDTSAEDRAPFTKEAEEQKQEYLKKVAEFKRKKNYINFLQKRVVVKNRENRMVNLRDMPKKPKTVYALFREDIKEEVPSGKGEGKGMNFVKNKFQEIDDDKKLKYKQKEAELKEQYYEEMKSYKEGETWKEFTKTSGKIKREMLTEAMKVMTLKFLNDAPKEPPKTAFAIYIGEKRRAVEELEGAPKKKSRQEAKDEVTKYKEEWGKLDKETQNVYDEKRKEKTKEWEGEVKAYMELPKWKEYMDEAKSLKVPVRSLLHKKNKAIKKLKNGMKLQPLPDRPESMPSKPPKARRIFFMEKRKEVDDPSKLQEMWDSLSEEEKGNYTAKEAEMQKDYQDTLKAFHESEEGKQYSRKVRLIQRSRATAVAKDKYLVEMPKKPLGHLQLYAKEKVKELKKAKPDLKGADLKAEITNSWKAMSDDEKNVYQEKGLKLYEEYEAKMQEFKETENFKKYESTMKRLKKPNKPKTQSGAPQKPASMPSKPPDALKLFKEQAGAGKKSAEIAEAFRELPSEEKEKFREQAEEGIKEYEEKLKEWKRSEEGKKYLKEMKAFEKRRKLANAKQRFLKDEPKRPPNAAAIFRSEKRSEYAPQFPELKGLALNGKLSEIFRGLADEEKQKYEDMAKESNDEYLKKMEEFKESANFKKYLAATQPKKPAGKAKAVKKDTKKTVPVPEGLPKKPPKAMALFMQANKGGGKLAEQAKAWRELGAEGQKKYVEEAQEKAEEYEKELQAFQKTAEGKRYFRLKAAADKRSRLSLGTYVAWMSSYYGRAWDAWAMEEVSEDGGPQSGSFSFGESLGKASTGWRSSPEQQAPSGRAHGDEGGADWYDIASNASSEGSWWKGDSWSWYSWDGGSDRSRSNWVYVARSGGDGWKRDGWHQWHGSRGGRDGRELHSGLCQESAECREDPGAPSERSGESEGEGGNVGRLPSGKVVSVQERADKDEEKKTQGKVTSSYPPVFRARQGESYREWKRAVKFWLKGEGQQLPYHLVGPRVMVQLRERAGQLVKHLEPEDVDDKQGLEKIFAVLEKSPLIRQSEKHRVDWHRKRLLALTRLPGESLESYITRASLYRDQLQGLDAGLAMGERFFVGHLLDHARITKRDKAMIKTHAVKETEIAITEAMMELAAELEGEAGCPIGQSESQVSGANGEEHMVQRGVVGFRFGKKEVKPALAVDGADDVGTEMAYSLDGIAEEGPGNDSCDEPDLPADVLHAEHEALALQFKAKQKMAEVRKMRNYYRKNDGDGRKGGGRGAARCFVCDEVGHLARDCPRAKAVNPSPVLMTTTANEETSAAAEWELLASLCRSPADASSVKEVYMVLSPQLGGEDNNTTFKMIQPHDTWWNLKELSRKVILDLGCMRNMVGLQWANDVIQSWKQKGRWLRVLEEEETFRFGDGNTLKSKYRLQMEATFGGRKVLLAFSVVPGPCPPLLSKQSHSMLGVQIDTANNTLSSKKLKISRYGLTETEAGHYAMSIDEFHVLKNDDETWKQNPPQMGIGEEVALFHVETADKEAFGSTHLGEQDQLLDGHFRSPVQPAGMSTLRQLESPDSSLSGDVGWQLRDDLPGECQSQGVVGGGEVAAGRGARSESQASTSQHGGGEKGNNTTAKQSSSLSRGATCGRDRGARDSWSDRKGAGDDSEEEDQAGRLCQEEDREQGPHGHPSGLPVLVELLERGVDFQHFEEHAEPLGDLHVEEVGVAASSEGGNQCGVQGQGKVETQSTVASLPFELRGGGALGPLGNSEAEAEIERPPSMKEGSVMWEGKSQRRSALAAQWPEELCRHMLQAAEKVWLHKEDEQFGIGLAEVADGGHHYALPVEPLPSPEGELRRQLEKVDWRGGQYDYIYFEGVARQAPYRIRRALAHLHVVLGHPSHDRLSRMLQVAGSGQVVTTTAHGLRCQICDAVRPTGSEPKASGERVTRFGEKVLSDSFFVWDHAGERFNVTHMLDSLTDYHIGVVSKTASAQVTAELLQHRWCGVFGVPETFQTDAGKEYEEVVSRLCRILDFRHEVVPPSAKWRQGQVERHGGIVKLMMMRVVATQQVVGLDGMKMVATACFAAKNRLANRMGLSPQQAVTGRNTSVPMSIMDQLCSGHVKQALNAQLDVRDALRRAERIRAAAIDSYHWMDSNEVLRRALHSRSRPPKLENLQEGMTVYVHDIPPSRRGLGKRLQDHSSWDGPALVVCVERNRNVPNRVWVRLRTKVKSFPLEKIRLATPDEMLGSHYIVQILDDMANDIKQGKLLVEEPPASRGQVHAREEIFDPEDLEQLDDEQAAKRIKQVRRQGMLDDVPAVLRQTTSSGSSTSCVLGRKLDNQERMDLLREDDEEMMQGKAPPGGGVPQALQSHASSVSSSAESKWFDVSPAKEPSKMKFQEKKQLFETFAKNKGRPSALAEAQRSIKKIIRKGKAASQRLARKGRMESEEAHSMVLYVDEAISDTEKKWQEACEHQELQEVFWAQQEGVAEEAAAMAEEVQKQHKQDAEGAKVVTGKARLEYDWSKLSQPWKDAYREPLLKAIRIYFDHQALEGVPVDQMIDARRILTTRFVLTNKGEEQLEKAVLKARLILGGHRDPDMGKFLTLAPTASMLAHNLINWISVQKQWVVKYEDVSSAFLQGKPLPPEREVYIKLPRGYPDYLLDFIHSKVGDKHKKDVLKLTKGGFGLPESPRLWYLCYKETLCECGMREMTLLPGVFAAYHPSGDLRALACIHVDDTRYCGDESSEEIWKKVHERLNFGDLRKATDGWVKFCGRWERQNADTLEFEYAMNDYAKALQKLETGFDVLSNESQTSDPKIQIDLAVLKQALMEGETNAFARWVPGHHMIADGMTKWYGNGALQRALKEGIETAKAECLGKDGPKEPKPPVGAYQIFVQEKRSSIMQTEKKNVGEIARELSALWSKCTEEEKKPYEEKADQAKEGSVLPQNILEEYKEALAAFKNSEGWKKFEKRRAAIEKKPKPKAKSKTKKTKTKGKGRAKAKAKAKGRGRPKPQEKDAPDSDSDSDVMGSDSDSSSSSSSD
eukprot:symbB.v1.2.015044.t1/scaffold1112.1/size147309/2